MDEVVELAPCSICFGIVLLAFLGVCGYIGLLFLRNIPEILWGHEERSRQIEEEFPIDDD